MGRLPLVWKLIIINVTILVVVISAIWMTIDFRAADYFTDIMREYNISPDTLHRMFLDAVHRYLLLVSVVGVAAASAVNFLLVRRVLAPLIDMAGMTDRIASGDFRGRVPVTSEDEIGEVAGSFNRMAESLERIHRLRRAMVADVAHELRTPLTNIRGYLEGLRDRVVASNAETFDSLHQETLRLATLVENLLELAKADATETTLNPERLRTREWLERLIDLYRYRFREKDVRVIVELDDAPETIRADPDKLTQVVRNLLENAWRYTNRGGRLRISAKRSPDGIALSFTNTGPGIDSDDLPFIFERFFRGEKSRSRTHGGEGIGLAIVRELVEAHGGRVGAESGPEETRVWFELPG